MFNIFWPFKLVSSLIKGIFSLILFLSCVLTIIAFMGDRGWLWSLSAHFRTQYLCIQLIALFFASTFFWLRHKEKQSAPSKIETWSNLVFLMVFVGLNLSQVAPYIGSSLFFKPASDVSHLKLLHSNVFGMVNPNRSLIAEVILTEKPDLIDFVEYTEPWRKDLETSGVLKAYPYRVVGASHMALYSKVPLRNARLVFPNPAKHDANAANIVASVMVNHRPVNLLIAHPPSPFTPDNLAAQQLMFQRWVRHRKQFGTNLLLVGDLNTTPWSREFSQLTQGMKLKDSQLGIGLQPSWPMFFSFLPIPETFKSLAAIPFGISIDHVLASEQIQILSRKTGAFVGSDHLPVIVEFTVQ